VGAIQESGACNSGREDIMRKEALEEIDENEDIH